MADNTTAQAGFRTYIGLRYVPIIAGLWDITKDYEQLMIVTYQGNSYTSKKPVPAGIPLTDDEYWVMTGNYNVQVANLQNEVEVAVRQILDYATDFETFKTQMMKLYTDFTVDADGKVLDKVEEYKRLLGEQYESFIVYVNQTLTSYRNEMTSFTAETNRRIDEFIESSNRRIDNKFNEYTTQINSTVSDYYSQTVAGVNSLQNQVNNLVLQSGNPEATSAEIAAARGNFTTLNGRLDSFDNKFLGYKVIENVHTINLRGYTDIGIYYAKDTYGDLTLIDMPENLINPSIFRPFTLVVYAEKEYNTFLKQILDVWDSETWSMRTFERYRREGTWDEWRETLNSNNSMIYSVTDNVDDFNHFFPINSTVSVPEFSIANPPLNAPDIINGDAYTVVTFGWASIRTQLVYTGTNNRCFIRRLYTPDNVAGFWTPWDYLTTKDDVDSALVTFGKETITVKVGQGENDDHTPTNISYNFNSSFGVNSFVICYGYTTGGEPTHAPNIPAETPYKVLTVGVLGDLTQYTFLNNGKTYVRFQNNGTWGSWISVSGGNNLGDVVDLTALNALPTNEVFNIANLSGGILPNGDSGVCYIYNSSISGNVYQTIVHYSGRVYYRGYNGSVWDNFAEPYNTNVVVNYNSFGGNGVPIATLNSQIVADTDYFTNKIIGVKFDGDVVGDITPNADDQIGYLITTSYETGGLTQIIHQTFITFNGRVFVRNYNGSSQQWSSFSTPYYTKSEIDTMLQNI